MKPETNHVCFTEFQSQTIMTGIALYRADATCLFAIRTALSEWELTTWECAPTIFSTFTTATRCAL